MKAFRALKRVLVYADCFRAPDRIYSPCRWILLLVASGIP